MKELIDEVGIIIKVTPTAHKLLQEAKLRAYIDEGRRLTHSDVIKEHVKIKKK